MITIFQIFERRYKNNGKGKICPVCNTTGLRYSTKKSDPYRTDFYRCPTCKFKWFSKWQDRHDYGGSPYFYDLHLASYSTEDNKKIVNKAEINPDLYSDIDIEINKFNL